MNKMRLAILGVAIVAGGAAAMMVGGSPPPPPQEAKVIVQQTPMDGVLVASRNIDVGTRVQPGDLRWAEWPRDSIAAELIRRSNAPKAAEELNEAVARSQFFAGEPIRRERLVQGQRSGFLAASLPPGFRAVAITIDQSGASSAGGFVLPNDRVDVISTVRDPSGGADSFESRTILTNVRVLAIGQNVQERNGERTVTGGNATLEVDPGQAEAIVLAQRLGQLSLALRSIMDQGKTEGGDEATTSSSDAAITIVRFGAASSVGRR
ncbi:MAG: Flp pilus assembly protein CpaB [Beijerinckiaceae bacterium]|nr:Flp pilus assembly protein CpaB [Beijerinckiaceae bacterium]